MQNLNQNDITTIQLILVESNKVLLQSMVELMNAQLRCIPLARGKVVMRTAEEDTEIIKRHSHD